MKDAALAALLWGRCEQLLGGLKELRPWGFGCEGDWSLDARKQFVEGITIICNISKEIGVYSLYMIEDMWGNTLKV